jgi:phage-related protein
MPRIVPFNDHREFNEPSTWIPLFEIVLPDETHYLTPNPEEVAADGHTYLPFPIMLNEVREDSSGTISTVQLTCSNIGGTLGTKLKQFNYAIDGYGVTFKQYSVQRDAVVYEEYLEIIKVGAITKESFILELGTFNAWLAQLLQEKYLSNFCWNRYKQLGCWIMKSDRTFISPVGFVLGSPDTCNKNVTDCKRHNNVVRFNSFPGIPGSGGFV